MGFDLTLAAQTGLLANQAATASAQSQEGLALSLAASAGDPVNDGYYLGDDRSGYRYVVLGVGLAGMSVLAGCDAPPPAPAYRQPVASVPTNQRPDCAPDSAGRVSEFCRQMALTEQRVEDMRDGRDQYNNHNQSLFWLSAAGGAIGLALMIGLFFGGRGAVRKIRARRAAQAVQPPPPQPPPPAAGATSGPDGKNGANS